MDCIGFEQYGVCGVIKQGWWDDESPNCVVCTAS